MAPRIRRAAAASPSRRRRARCRRTWAARPPGRRPAAGRRAGCHPGHERPLFLLRLHRPRRPVGGPVDRQADEQVAPPSPDQRRVSPFEAWPGRSGTPTPSTASRPGSSASGQRVAAARERQPVTPGRGRSARWSNATQVGGRAWAHRQVLVDAADLVAAGVGVSEQHPAEFPGPGPGWAAGQRIARRVAISRPRTGRGARRAPRRPRCAGTHRSRR